jgi:hypothetical protein
MLEFETRTLLATLMNGLHFFAHLFLFAASRHAGVQFLIEGSLQSSRLFRWEEGRQSPQLFVWAVDVG